MRVVTVIQARMGSTRFPGKMMERLGDAPLVDWVLRRTMRSRSSDAVVLATTDHPRDDILAGRAKSLGAGLFRGSENDVLGRYVGAARESKADVVVRVCADRPLVDPDIVDQAVATFRSEAADLVYNHVSGGGQNWPRGFGAEVLSADLLYRVDEAATRDDHREHVTLYVWDNRDRYCVVPVRCPAALDPGTPDVRFDVDTPEDLAGLRRLCAGLSDGLRAEEVVARWRAAATERLPPPR